MDIIHVNNKGNATAKTLSAPINSRLRNTGTEMED